MAGHSKWAQIKRDKAKNDSARGAVFTRMSREIIVAARLGGGDPAGNFRLRTAIDKAKAAGVPSDNIKRAIAKGTGAEGGENLEEVRYEGYGPAGVAVLVDTVTDNRNRTVADLRTAFTRNGGNLGETGCVGWMFAEKGQVVLADPEGALDEDSVLAIALEAGAEDVRRHDGFYEVLCAPGDLEAVSSGLREAALPVESAEPAQIPASTISVDDPEAARKLLRLVECLEDLDDVQRVAANFDIPDAVLAGLPTA